MSLEAAREHLSKYGFADRIRLTELSSATVELAAKAVGADPDEIAKTLSFLVQGQPVLILASGLARIDNRKFKDTFHTKAKMIPGDQVEALVGHAPGGVCPFGVREGTAVYLDVSLKKHEIVYPAVGTGSSAVPLRIPELELCAEPRGWVDVCKEAAPAERGPEA